ncbi:MAG: hypothetical protein PHW52_00520 [Candidatus Pacebacteria bacterium]|nr:hypothetical protein [Candidatus Paceibacterota bacterium]
MKNKKVVYVALPVLAIATLIGFNVFASESNSQDLGSKGQGFHMGKGMCSSTMTFAEWKTKEIERINSITDDMFSKMKERQNIQLTIDQWKQQEIEKVNQKTEDEFKKMQEMCNNHPGNIKDMTFAEWKTKEIERINSITDDMFSKMKERQNIQLTIDQWKQQEIEKVNQKTEDEFKKMQESFPEGRGMGRGRGFEMGLGMKMLDISNMDYNTWKQEMINNINSVSEANYNKVKENMKNFQLDKGQNN